jgi:UrcA family protein
MNASINSILSGRRLAMALAVGTLTILGAAAHAEELDPITLSAPSVKIIGHDDATLAPIEDVTVQARIAADPETLRSKSGVVLLKDRVVQAARKACFAADPSDFYDDTCVQQAVKAAKPQVSAAVAQARASSVNG